MDRRLQHATSGRPGGVRIGMRADWLNQTARVDVQIGDYRIERVLGEGGMGRVYAGRDLRTQRAVAVKVARRAAHGTDPR